MFMLFEQILTFSLPGQRGRHGRAHVAGGRGVQGQPGPAAHSDRERARAGQVAGQRRVRGRFQGNVDAAVHTGWIAKSVKTHESLFFIFGVYYKSIYIDFVFPNKN